MGFISERDARRVIVDIGRRMYSRGFVAANDGNISVRTGGNEIIATPTGVSKGFMTEDMLVKLSMDGRVLGSGSPSSEILMHLQVYAENPEVFAVTHAHPPIATSFAVAGIALERPILPEAFVNLGTVPVARYATPGTPGVADSVAPFCRTHRAVLLANHGALTWGRDAIEAYFRLETVEQYATVLMLTGSVLGRANELTPEQLSALALISGRLSSPLPGK